MVFGQVRTCAWVKAAPVGRVIRKANTLYVLASIGKFVPFLPSGAASGFPVSRYQSCASPAVVVPENRPFVKRMLAQLDEYASFDPRKAETSVPWFMSHGSWDARVANSFAALIGVLVAGGVTPGIARADTVAGYS